MSVAKNWIETWSAHEWPEALEADQELVFDLLDCLMREVAPLALESLGLQERGQALRSLGSIRDGETLAAYRRAAEGAKDEVQRLGSPPRFLDSLESALEAPERERLEVDGASWLAVAEAIKCGAPDFGVRACLGRVVERHRGSELRPQAALPW